MNDLGVDDTEAVQARVRHRVLSLFKRKGILTEDEVLNLRSWKGKADTVTIIMACWRQALAIELE